MQGIRFFTYELTFAALAAAGGSSPQNFKVENAYDFHWHKSEAFVFDAAGLGVSTLQWPNLEVLLSDGSTQQQINNQATSINSLFGTGAIPFILPRPHVLGGGSTLFATVTNQHTTTAFSVRLAFSGVIVAKGTQLPQRAGARSRVRLPGAA